MHEIVAHLTAGAVALADQAGAYLEGKPIPPFGSWEERDARFRALDDAELHDALDASESQMTKALAAIAATDHAAVIPGGGWGFSVDHLAIHMRQEFALHRWDLVGDDALSSELLAQPELLEHSISLMDRWLLARGLQNEGAADTPFSAWIRCSGEPDLLIEVSGGRGRMRFEPYREGDGGGGFVEADPAARLLLIWGRHPSDARRITSTLSAAALARLVALLSGF